MTFDAYNPPLHVVQFIGSRRGDAERGPEVRLQQSEADLRSLSDGDLVWLYGPRRHDLVSVRVDEAVPRGGVIVRDVAGVAVTEFVRLLRVDAKDRSPLTNPPPLGYRERK